ncbi:MAG TPA: SH3 domain-containing protein [Rhizomicrobium sp.]|nr:SH3 domain-containing protein [Rhizomicrobium sp.]
MIRFAAILWILSVVAAEAAPAKILRYVSQRPDKAYLREGPSYAHRVLWVYRHRGYPFAVIAEFDIWRRVRAPDGTMGWMSHAMLSEKRTVLITGKTRVNITADEGGGKVMALADPGAIAGLSACTRHACRISGKDVEGWIPKSRIWGVGANEVFDKLPRR